MKVDCCYIILLMQVTALRQHKLTHCLNYEGGVWDRRMAVSVQLCIQACASPVSVVFFIPTMQLCEGCIIIIIMHCGCNITR